MLREKDHTARGMHFLPLHRIPLQGTRYHPAVPLLNGPPFILVSRLFIHVSCLFILVSRFRPIQRVRQSAVVERRSC